MTTPVLLLNAHPLLLAGFEADDAAALALQRICPMLREHSRVHTSTEEFRVILEAARAHAEPIGLWPGHKTALVGKCLRRLDPGVEILEIALTDQAYAGSTGSWYKERDIGLAVVDPGFDNVRRGLVCYFGDGRRFEVIAEPEASAPSPTLAARLAARVGSFLSDTFDSGRRGLLVCSGRIAPGCREAVFGLLRPDGAGPVRIVDSRHFVLREDLRPEVVKFNESEARAILGLTDTRPRSVAAHLRGLPRGTAYIVTLGERGVVAVTADGQATGMAVPTVPVVNPIGAGDTFTAVLAHRLARGSELTEALPDAAVQATLSTTVREEGWITGPGGRLSDAAAELIITAL